MSTNEPHKPTYYLGLMSGTSLDGVDVVITNIDKDTPFRLIAAHTYPIPDALKKQLISLSQERKNDELDNYAKLDVQLGNLFADCCQNLIKKHDISSKNVRAIGSHGQTLRHYPVGEFRTTLQIGDPNIIAYYTKITTLADFRRRDMAAGGQGAPLVPPFHQALFQTKEKNRVILNIGGIANITWLPAKNSQQENENTVIGFDTGPGNGLMDDWCNRHFDKKYDENGLLASQGQVNPELLDILLKDPYFAQAQPKSTGREYFTYDWIEKHLSQLRHAIPKHDVLRTLLELTCKAIVKDIDNLPSSVSEVLVCGGGVKNKLLMERLKSLLPDSLVSSTENFGLHPDWVEASAFAWLAYQTLHSTTGNLPSVTGAKEPVILGAIWPA